MLHILPKGYKISNGRRANEKNNDYTILGNNPGVNVGKYKSGNQDLEA
jgi:hypothetical protein